MYCIIATVRTVSIRSSKRFLLDFPLLLIRHLENVQDIARDPCLLYSSSCRAVGSRLSSRILVELPAYVVVLHTWRDTRYHKVVVVQPHTHYVPQPVVVAQYQPTVGQPYVIGQGAQPTTIGQGTVAYQSAPVYPAAK
ncbi:hypothetical protein RB195_003564 [Necator americanus]|uniref:Uncharacterized protein n=1 Tax=Necator americanus TaxID=51031 RepID=A0ABR1DP58_NECAM